MFQAGAIVKAILSVDEGKAYLQNADTNAYLEGKFEAKADLVGGKVPAEQLPTMNYAPADHVDDTVKHISAAEREAWDAKAPASHTHDDRYYTETEVNNLLTNKAPAYTYGTADLTAGSSPLASGMLHFVYE